jgi:hypothetical protein
MEGRSDSDSACGRLGVGAVCARRARWSPKKGRGGGGVEEMIRGALGSVSARKKGMAGRG